MESRRSQTRSSFSGGLIPKAADTSSYRKFTNGLPILSSAYKHMQEVCICMPAALAVIFGEANPQNLQLPLTKSVRASDF